jgi:hypothetical protein
MAGLALIAAGVFLTGVSYLGWSGGSVGSGAIDAVRIAVGVIAYALPVVAVAGGALVLVRKLLPERPPVGRASRP